MTVLRRFSTDEYGTIELGWNGTSVEVVYTEDDGTLVNLMIRPEDLVDALDDVNATRRVMPP